MTEQQDSPELTLTKDEFGMLVDSGVPTHLTTGYPRVVLALNILAVISLVAWNVLESHYENTWLGVLLLFNGVSIYNLNKQRDTAINLIRKLQGTPREGRRAIDTAVPTELAP